jgi:4-nitrophenyl phosphatase
LGLDRGVNFQKMRDATLLVRSGLPFYATNPDRTFPTPRGEIPGAGAWAAVVSTASDVTPIYAGKPNPHLFELARQRLGTARAATLVIGDRLETDAAGAQAAGLPCAIVLTGVATEAEARAWTPKLEVISQSLWTLLEA